MSEKYKSENNLNHKRGRSKILISILGVITILASLIGGYMYYQSSLGNSDLVQAALNCPAGSTLNTAGTGCVSTSPSGYTCPEGQTLGGNGAQCFVYQQTGTSYTCPSGTLQPNGVTCRWVRCYLYQGSTWTCYGGDDARSGSCYEGGLGWNWVSAPPDNYCIADEAYWGIPDLYNVPATPTPTYGWVFSGNATPAFNTPVTSGVTYTPESGQISNFTCTPTTATSGGSVVCSGQATGAPSGVPYSGNITITIDNGGGTAIVPLTASGSFSTTVDVGTITGVTPVVKNATTNIGGTSSVTVNSASTPITETDIPSLTVVCGTTSGSVTSAPVNSTITCTFPLPVNKTLPSDFKLSIGNGAVDAGGSTPAQSCSESANIVTCLNVPTGNSIGNIPIYGNLGSGNTATKTATGETVAITGSNFGNISWVFNPDQGGTSPLFRSQDNTSITVNNFRTIFDPTPSSNTRYTCTLEYRNFNDRLITTPTWNTISSTPVTYNTASGCIFNFTKTQRGNALNHSLRLTITDTSITTPTASNPNTYTFYNEYLFRFLGAGVAFGG